MASVDTSRPSPVTNELPSEEVESDTEDFEDLIRENELESASDWTADDETRPICLFCEITFDDSDAVWDHCVKDHDFDFKKLRRGLGLDFFGKVKLINYVRSQVKAGNQPELNRPELFLEDSQFLKPTLQDDALLFGIQDDDSEEEEDDPDVLYEKEQLAEVARENAERVKVLQKQLQELQFQFDEYKDIVRTVLNRDLDSDSGSDSGCGSPEGPSRASRKRVGNKYSNEDDHYFESYAYNDIHEIMLKDSIRTDSYRDFIYDNKDIFKDKIVLDVGCGTGILSMFAAKAGARKVYAVDNSDIIEKAIANVHENGLDRIIQCYRGKIEEIRLPVQKVDIIVSEWMGYALLYEAMLDSVLVARDKYLAPNGLMVPSEVRLLVAGLRDAEFINDKVNFWNDIYGFKMSAMKPRIYDDVLIENFKPSSIVHQGPFTFRTLQLHDITTADLEFTSPIRLTIPDLSNEFDGTFDGLVIYFDNYFTRSRDEVIPEDARAETFKPGNGSLGFTTGPWGPKYTHWRSGALLFNKQLQVSPGVNELAGEITYEKRKSNPRELIIGLELTAGDKKLAQSYFMR
ncbi:S-adenosyl-L-methionine-dependent methyltransferase [Lipomyces tetrasporus]|uniref:type I protein arginine methyltransferase n=1 Tax=Lipomyces tetrasporus TaxID=54092 RepID=A0AAD7VQQ6_9ASCO|nr:S-adenosyl-L-methionine-dependent methyltransferase [Lipomyces tetrasporus]KAJ8099172.1 S-adenosyl-L-methionine-dependent methyltransferase [Lipomyces tetrasporus]